MATINKDQKEQFWKLYEKLPQELKDVLWAQETGDNIYEICQKYEATEHLGEIVELTGQVLIGLVLPQEFSAKIETLGVKKDVAELIAREINRLVFYPVKPALEQLHKMEIEVSAKIVTPQPSGEEGERPRKEEKPSGPDTYREPIE
ncbi:MAG: hypothetical protein Greene041639_25 [Parcubacteria group bacterium Greene0416_39]|nr:MAG: hypothetical protein Greene041639_25 [Parcubacteria group bacterium Greene0416_39]TSC98355.1 MAG: hypothetical protein Greene101447_98 [Parcubacteria group bacterium Greene1014_47]